MEDILEHIDTAEKSKSTVDLTDLIIRRIRLLSQRRVAWLRKIWMETSAQRTESFDVHMEVDGYLYDLDIPSEEQKWIMSEPSIQKVNEEIEEINTILGNDQDSRLSILAQIFGLNRVETDIIQACLAISIDPNLARVYAYIQDNSARGYVTESLVAKLFGYGSYIVLPVDSPLKIWGLIKEIHAQQGESLRLECDPFIRNWLLGMDGMDEALISFTQVQPVKSPLAIWPAKSTLDEINRMLDETPENLLRIFIEGSEGSGRKSFAAFIGKQFGLHVLAVNSDRIPENRWPLIYMLIQRQAFLTNTAIAWYGESMPGHFWPINIPSYNLQFIIGEPDDALTPNNHFLDLRIVLPKVSFAERLSLWKKYVPLSATWPKVEMEEMVLRHESNVGQIVAIGRKMTPTIADANEALRADSGRRLGNLAQQMPGSFAFDDLVLPDYTRKGIVDFIFEATDRVQFWEQPNAMRLFPYGRSLIGLFTGSPGTGKTMAAQVIAATLQLELYRIDLSNVVSKYIGESSKNIERILSRAKNMNVVLLFDEADALFGKRTDIKDAHDRYANTDTNYLLQAIESYPGIVILSSNKKSNIDSGFIRRLRYVLEFSKPDAPQRLLIWKNILGELSDNNTLKQLEPDLAKLSTLMEITGAQIKQTILSALFMARKEKIRINSMHILAGLERELAKEGKGLGKQVYQNFTKRI